jgi:pimeloyl-ACP methyl ester carboxylesterase
MFYFFLIIILCFIIIRVTVIIAANRVCKPKVRSWEETKDIESKYDQWSIYEKIEKEDLNFTLDDGYLIHGTFIKAPTQSNKYIILTHGFRYSRLGGVKYLDIFLKNNYNIYLYDLRNHGKNIHGGIIQMGEIEHKDLSQIIDKIYEKFGSDIILGLHGESLGAFSSMMVTKLKAEKIKFVIEDCGYSYTRDELIYQLKKQMKMPVSFYELVAKYAKTKYNQHWDDMDLKPILKKSNIPMLFIHGKADKFTPPQMAKELFDAHNGYKKLCYIENAGHAQSVVTDYKLYTETVNSFLQEIGY